jgi:hypothetical protein
MIKLKAGPGRTVRLLLAVAVNDEHSIPSDASYLV